MRIFEVVDGQTKSSLRTVNAGIGGPLSTAYSTMIERVNNDLTAGPAGSQWMQNVFNPTKRDKHNVLNALRHLSRNFPEHSSTLDSLVRQRSDRLSLSNVGETFPSALIEFGAGVAGDSDTEIAQLGKQTAKLAKEWQKNVAALNAAIEAKREREGKSSRSSAVKRASQQQDTARDELDVQQQQQAVEIALALAEKEFNKYDRTNQRVSDAIRDTRRAVRASADPLRTLRSRLSDFERLPKKKPRS